MDLTALKAAIDGDAALAAMAAAGQDADIAAALNASAGVKIVERLVNERTLLAAFANPADGEAVLVALETAAQVDPIVARAVRWMAPSEQGVDVGHAATRAMIDQLVIAEVLTVAQAAAIKALAEVPSSTAETQFGRRVTARDVSAALRDDRPDGQLVSP